MVKRHQRSLAIATAMMVWALILISVHWSSDLYSPALFLFKAAIQMVVLLSVIVFSVLALYRRNKIISITSLTAVLLTAPILLPDSLGQKQPNLAGLATTKVATFSTLTRTQNVADIAHFAIKEKPGVICIQEVNQDDRKSLIQELNGFYKYFIENSNNQITFSQFPIKTTKDLGQILIGELAHPQWGAVEIINTHMPRPYRTRGIDSGWQALLEHLPSSDKLVLCGDLNITPNNSLYSVLRNQHKLQDSLTSGYGFTFPNSARRMSLIGPLIRIDYIMTKGLLSSHTKTLNASNDSDHRAVVTNLALHE